MTIHNKGGLLPGSLDYHDLTPLQAAWDAWEAHGTQQAAAEALGLTRSGFASRIANYRRATGTKGRPTTMRNTRRAELADAAWEAWKEYGTIGKAATALGLTYSGLRRRLEHYWDSHGLREGTEPVCLRQWPAKQARIAWLAWWQHGTHKAAAAALGLSVNTVARRVADHRENVGMPATATPADYTVEGLYRWADQ